MSHLLCYTIRMRIKKSMSLDSSEKKTSNPTLERLEVPKASSQDSVMRGQSLPKVIIVRNRDREETITAPDGKEYPIRDNE